MRRFAFLAAGFLLLAVAEGAQGQATPIRLGYINSQAILQQTPGAQETQNQIQQEMQGFQAQVQQMAEELDQMMQQYDQQQLTMSAETKQRREQEILDKRQEYEAAAQRIEQQAQARRQELIQPIMDRINDVIETLRAEGNFAFIFDVAAGSIIAADPALDVTDQVVQRLQAMARDTISGGSR